MKEKIYRVTVYATFSKEVLVNAEDEEAALDYVQDICDNTNLMDMSDGELVDLEAEDVIALEEDEAGCACECKPIKDKPCQSIELHIPSQPVPETLADVHIPKPLFDSIVNLVCEYYSTSGRVDRLQNSVRRLLDSVREEIEKD